MHWSLHCFLMYIFACCLKILFVALGGPDLRHWFYEQTATAPRSLDDRKQRRILYTWPLGVKPTRMHLRSKVFGKDFNMLAPFAIVWREF